MQKLLELWTNAGMYVGKRYCALLREGNRLALMCIPLYYIGFVIPWAILWIPLVLVIMLRDIVCRFCTPAEIARDCKNGMKEGMDDVMNGRW